jgi:hypothetical protein
MTESKTTEQIKDEWMKAPFGSKFEDKRWLPLEETRDEIWMYYHFNITNTQFSLEQRVLLEKIFIDVFGPAKPSGLDVPVKVASP